MSERCLAAGSEVPEICPAEGCKGTENCRAGCFEMAGTRLAEGERCGAVALPLLQALPQRPQLRQVELLAQLLHVPVVQQPPALCAAPTRAMRREAGGGSSRPLASRAFPACKNLLVSWQLASQPSDRTATPAVIISCRLRSLRQLRASQPARDTSARNQSDECDELDSAQLHRV